MKPQRTIPDPDAFLLMCLAPLGAIAFTYFAWIPFWGWVASLFN